MKPIVNGLEEEYAGLAVIEKLDIDDPNTDEAKVTYKFRVQPYVVLLDGEGHVVESWQGYRDKAVFEEALATILGQ